MPVSNRVYLSYVSYVSSSQALTELTQDRASGAGGDGWKERHFQEQPPDLRRAQVGADPIGGSGSDCGEKYCGPLLGG